MYSPAVLRDLALRWRRLAKTYTNATAQRLMTAAQRAELKASELDGLSLIPARSPARPTLSQLRAAAHQRRDAQRDSRRFAIN